MLVGKTVARVEENPQADEGLVITFDDGTVFEFGYSGDEGSMSINSQILDAMDIVEMTEEK